MALVIATATGIEMKAVLDGLGVQNVAPPAYGVWRRETICGRECLLLSSGIGLINAAWSLGRLLGSEKHAQGVLNLGVAGSFDLVRLPLCAAVVVEREIWPEYGLLGEGGDCGQGSVDPRGLTFSLAKGPDGPIWDRIELAPEDAAKRMGITLPQGLARDSSLSVSGVTGTAARCEALRALYDPGLENMEGFGFALGCLQAGLPFLELRTVSNRVAARPPKDWKLAAALRALGGAAAQLLSGV